MRRLAAASGFLSGPSPTIDTELAGLAISEGMGPLLGARVAAGEVDVVCPDVRARLVACHLACLARETAEEPELEALQRALARAGVEAVLMKGAALARSIYPRPGTRLRGDVDLLVPTSDWQKALGAATSSGLAVGPSEGRRLTAARDRERTFVGTHLLVEIHRAPAPTLLFPVRCAEVLSRSTPHRDGWLVPEAHDSFVLAAVHASLHGLFLPFRWLADGLGLAANDRLAPDRVVARATEWKARRATAVWILLLAVFGLPDRGWGEAVRELTGDADLSPLVRLAGRAASGQNAAYLAEVRRLRHHLVDHPWRAWAYHVRGASLLAGDLMLRPMEFFR